MTNWREAYPGWLVPWSLPLDTRRWPDYTSDDYTRPFEDLPDPSAIIKVLDFGQPDRRAWGAWINARDNDKPLAFDFQFHGPVADRLYESARYKFLVPAWRRAIVRAVTELDDIEDQISTIVWAMEWITKKVIPIPPIVMNNAQRLQRTLDCAEKIIAGITPFRFQKAEHGDCLQRIKNGKAGAKARKAGLLAWFRENWGRLIEAAQATGTWFDVGIVLGPIMGWIEEGMWGVMQKTVDNYLIGVDALMPGYREDFNRNAAELSDSIDAAWEETWESLIDWTTDSVEVFYPLDILDTDEL